jgi:hypothetical protein
MAINNAILDVGPIVDVNNIGNVDGTAFVFPKSPATQLTTSTTGREWDPRANFIYSYAR